jgi:hypothetical protein
MLRTRKELSKTAMAPFAIFMGVLIYALSSP